MIDVGTFLGVSGYILGTSSPNLEKLYAIENIDDLSSTQRKYWKYIEEIHDFSLMSEEEKIDVNSSYGDAYSIYKYMKNL